MSALSILYLIIPLPILFIVHDAEEVFMQHRWIKAHRESLIVKFPKLRPLILQLSKIGTKAFAIAALEELLILILATCYVLVGGPWALQIWASLFLAFSIHLAVHIAQAIAVRGYVPGLATSLPLLAYAYIGTHSLWLVMSLSELLILSIVGVAVMAANLKLAHLIGMKLGAVKATDREAQP